MWQVTRQSDDWSPVTRLLMICHFLRACYNFFEIHRVI